MNLDYIGKRPQEIKARASDGRFCDLIAEGMTVAEAGRNVGLGPSPSFRKWKRICAEMGSQAV